MNERQQLIDKRILRTLRALNGVLQPEVSVLDGVSISLTPRLIETEFHERLRWLESRQLILGVPDAYGAAKWKITDAGRAFCIEQGF